VPSLKVQLLFKTVPWAMPSVNMQSVSGSSLLLQDESRTRIMIVKKKNECFIMKFRIILF
ncbi:MAG: hypothetical protein ACPG5P_04510, partial [Saprospiraceae bacterium]